MAEHQRVFKRTVLWDVVQRAHLRMSTATIAFLAERSSARRRAGDSLVADAIVSVRSRQKAKAIARVRHASRALRVRRRE
jgi:hypothetical protein